MLALQKRGFTAILDLPLLKHLTHDDFDVLVVNLHTLKAIDVLHLVDHVVRQRLNTHDCKNVMRGRVAVHDVVTLLDEVAFGHRDVLALGHHVFDGLKAFVRRNNADPALVLEVTAEFHIAIQLRNNRVIFRTTGFEQFGHTRQTTGDVLCLGAFTRDPRNHVTGFDLLPFFDGQNGVD